jgi:hypothetical protein
MAGGKKNQSKRESYLECPSDEPPAKMKSVDSNRTCDVPGAWGLRKMEDDIQGIPDPRMP